jgi:hypothetical protein
MMKQILFVGAAVFSIPAMAQQAQPAPGAVDDLAPTEQVATQPAPAQQQTAAQAGQPATAAQVAMLVDREFPAHDGDKDGELTLAEFGAWMDKLHASSPQPQANRPANWNEQAFALADSDKSAKVTKAELVSFLTRGA